MGSEDTMSLGVDSMDLYSKVKLRGLNGKVHGGKHGNSGLYNVKSMSTRTGKSRVSVGIKSRRIDKSEGKITVINSGELATNQGGSRGLKMTCLMAVTTRESDIPYSDREGDLRGVIFDAGCSLDEETAIEVLGALKESRSETMATGFKVGDLVWGNVDSHPWWPGQIFDEALASSPVKQTKIKGRLLVAFFGDNTYGWFKSTDLLPFEPNYGGKLPNKKKNGGKIKRSESQSKAFPSAVQEAVDEVNRRAALALSCRCRNPSDGYEEGAIYPVDQIKRAREDFKPAEMVSFLQKLALKPIDTPRDGNLLSNGAKVLAYRKAVFAENDPTYAEAFGVQARSPGDSTVAPNYRGKALAEGLSGGHSQTNEVCGSKVLGKRVIEENVDAKKLTKIDGASKVLAKRAIEETVDAEKPKRTDGASKVMRKRAIEETVDAKKLTRTDGPSKASGDHVNNNRSEIPRRNGKEPITVGREPQISKPLKTLPINVPLEKAPGKGTREPPPLKNRDKTKALASLKGVEEDLAEQGATLLIKFPAQAKLPTKGELKARFVRFGPINISATNACLNSCRCQVGFKKMSDAEAARDHLRRNGNMFGNTKVSCYLQVSEVASSPRSPKSLKIPKSPKPQLWSLSSREEASGSEEGGITLHSNEVKRLEDSSMKSQQTIPPASLAPLTVTVNPNIFAPVALSQFADAMNKKHLESSQTSTTTRWINTVDIARPMLKLLNEIDQCFGDLRQKQKHWLYRDY